MSGKLIRSTSVIGSMTLLSRISGLVRDVVFAHLLGDRAAADVFFVAFRIPNLLRDLFAEGALSAAFVTVFTEYDSHKEKEKTWKPFFSPFARAGIPCVTPKAAAWDCPSVSAWWN